MGVDIYCVNGFKANMPEVDEETAIAHKAARGLQTPNGRFPPWPDWGQDLRQFVLGKHPMAVVEALAKRQILKDERVRTCKVVAERAGATINLTITIVKEADGTAFVFSLTVTEAAASLVSLQAG